MGHLNGAGGHTLFYKMNILTWLTLLLGIVTLSTPGVSSEPRVVCYYTNWSVYRPGTARFNPQNINPYLCTHLIYAFGGFTKDNTLKPFDKYQDIEKGGYAKFTGLKTYNKNLKTLLAIGGWNEGSSRFSPMVASRERRKEFVRNVIKFLRQNRFDGLDLDWEYPAFRDGGKPKDRENYAKLVRELREEFDRESEKTGKPRLLLTMAVPAGIEYIQKGFDVKTLNQYLDWMNLLTYDYHSAFEPAVNHHAPLYPLEEPNEYSVDTELNIDYTIKFYLESGADRDKLVLGIPTYGRSYTLFNADAVEVGSPADGPGEQGDATREKGYLAYYEICEALKPKNKKRSTDEDSEEYSEEEDEEWTVMHPNPDAMGPVAFKGNQWVGYDDIDIVKKKAKYVAENGLGGIMFWSIDNDDFRGNCHEKPYPLIEAAKEAYIAGLGSSVNIVSTERAKTRTSTRRRNRPKSTTSTTTERPSTSKRNKPKNSVTSTTPKWNNTPEPPTTPDPGSDFKCVDEGFYPHPRDCKKYFWCLDSGPSNLGIVAHQFTCPSGLFFNKAADSCDFARNVLCKMPASTTKAPSTRAATTSSTTRTTSISTTRKPVRLSTKNSVLFRTTSTTTPEPESEEEYEEDVPEEAFEEDAEDPRVIKELIDLIKKVGGVEQLEKQLHLSEVSVSTSDGRTTTPSSFNKKLYQKVLERARGKNKYTGKNAIQEQSQSALNSRRGPQNQGLEPTEDKDKLLKKDRPQYTTINRQRASSPPAAESSEEEVNAPAGRARVTDDVITPRSLQNNDVTPRSLQNDDGITPRSLQYVNIRRARPSTSDTADDTASRNALFERAESYVSVSEPNSLDVVNARRENIPEYVTIRRQRPTTEETTTAQYQESKETESQETALEKEISSQPQYTSIIRTRATTVSPPEPVTTEPARTRPPTTLAPEEHSTPEPTTVLAVQISSFLNSPSSEEIPDTTLSQTTEEAITSTTTTTAAPTVTPRRTLLRRRGSTTSTTSTTSAPSSSSPTQTRRPFLRRTKPPSATNETTEAPTTLVDSNRGGSKYKLRNATRPLSTRRERPTGTNIRNFVRRRPEGGVNSSTVATSSSPVVTRRPFRVSSRRRPSSSTTQAPTTTQSSATTLVLDSDEYLQDIEDIDIIEDPTLEPRPKKTPKIQRRPLVNLKDVDQNPSATNEDETKRQSKKYSASFKQNQLEGLLRARDSREEVTTTEKGSTLEDDAETVLAIATHQLITAPLPSSTDYDEPKRRTTQYYTDTTETTDTYRVTPTTQTVGITYQPTDGQTVAETYTPRGTDKYQTDIDAGKAGYSLRQFNYITGSTLSPTNDYTNTYNPIPTFTSRDVTGFTGTNPLPTKFTSREVTGFTGTNPLPTKFTSREMTGFTGTPITTIFTNPEVTGFTGTSPLPTKFTSREVTGFTGSSLPTKFTSREVTGFTGSPLPTKFTSREVTGFTGTPITTFTNPEVTGFTGTSPLPTKFTSREVTGFTGTVSPLPTFTSREVTGFTGNPLPTKFISPEVTGYTGNVGIERGVVKYSSDAAPTVLRAYGTVPSPTVGLSRSSQDSYFTREYLLESPITKSYDEEYQYISPTTPQPPRKVFRKKIQRRISTTLRPTTPILPEVTTPRGNQPPKFDISNSRGAQLFDKTRTEFTSPRSFERSTRPSIEQSSRGAQPFERTRIPEITTPRAPQPFEKRPEAASRGNQVYEKSTRIFEITTPRDAQSFEKSNTKNKPVIGFDYYDDSAEKVALKYAEGTKVILHGKGSIECLDVGNFPHPSSCKKFISCARMEFGSLLGWEYICPQGLSFDPVGGICNWSAGLGCDEKNV